MLCRQPDVQPQPIHTETTASANLSAKPNSASSPPPSNLHYIQLWLSGKAAECNL